MSVPYLMPGSSSDQVVGALRFQALQPCGWIDLQRAPHAQRAKPSAVPCVISIRRSRDDDQRVVLLGSSAARAAPALAYPGVAALVIDLALRQPLMPTPSRAAFIIGTRGESVLLPTISLRAIVFTRRSRCGNSILCSIDPQETALRSPVPAPSS